MKEDLKTDNLNSVNTALKSDTNVDNNETITTPKTLGEKVKKLFFCYIIAGIFSFFGLCMFVSAIVGIMFGPNDIFEILRIILQETTGIYLLVMFIQVLFSRKSGYYMFMIFDLLLIIISGLTTLLNLELIDFISVIIGIISVFSFYFFESRKEYFDE